MPPGEPTVITPPADIRITNVALGDEIADEKGRTTVKLVYLAPGARGDDDDEDEEDEDDKENEDEDDESMKVSTAVLCSLTYGRVRLLSVCIEYTALTPLADRTDDGRRRAK